MALYGSVNLRSALQALKIPSQVSFSVVERSIARRDIARIAFSFKRSNMLRISLDCDLFSILQSPNVANVGRRKPYRPFAGWMVLLVVVNYFGCFGHGSCPIEVHIPTQPRPICPRALAVVGESPFLGCLCIQESIMPLRDRLLEQRFTKKSNNVRLGHAWCDRIKDLL